MKIQTTEDFWIAAEIWYQRIWQLKEIMEDENRPWKQREKAEKLWLIMYNRMLKINAIAIELKTPKYPFDTSRKGGIKRVDFRMN